MTSLTATAPIAGAVDERPILVVDDDPDILALIRQVLADAGFAVATAADGRAALSLSRDRPPALVVLDLMLPDLDGEAVARTLRAWYGATLPIVLISASGRIRQTAGALGILAYLDKPFEVDDLLKLLTARLTPRAPEVAALWQAAEHVLAALHEQGPQGGRAASISQFLPTYPNRRGRAPEE